MGVVVCAQQVVCYVKAFKCIVAARYGKLCAFVYVVCILIIECVGVMIHSNGLIIRSIE